MVGFQIQRRFAGGGIAELHLVTMDDGRRGLLRRLKWSRVLKPSSRSRFVAGMRLRRQLQEGGHIVCSWENSVWRLRPYELLEFIPGNNLKHQIGRRSDLVRRDYRQVLGEAALGLNSVHSAGYMHLDVKPENFMIQYEEDVLRQVKLTDFDMARPAEYHCCRLGGTRKYMAPEQLQQKRSYRASDVFAFGVMAYYLISGQMPFTGKNLKQQLRHQASELILAQPLDEIVPSVDRKWSNAVMRCLAKQLRQRYADISGFLDDVMS